MGHKSHRNWLKQHNPSGLKALATGRPDKPYQFWQDGGGYDRNLRSVRDTHEKLYYIHNNPVIRKLVARPEDWPWSSAQAWVTGADEPLKIDRESFPVLEKKPWEI